MQTIHQPVHRSLVNGGTSSTGVRRPGRTASLAVVAASSLLLLSGHLALRGPALIDLGLNLGSNLGSTLGYATELGSTQADRAQASRDKSRPETLVAAFVPAPKHPPKATQGTGSR
jgi:hypothetical protein